MCELCLPDYLSADPSERVNKRDAASLSIGQSTEYARMTLSRHPAVEDGMNAKALSASAP